MEDNQYPNSGAMFPRQKRTENTPDYGGDFTIDGEVLDHVVKCYERGEVVKLEISGWRRQARKSGAFISLKVNTPYDMRQSEGQRVPPPRRDNRSFQGRQQSSRQQSQNSYAAARGGYSEVSRGDPRGLPDRRVRPDLNDEIPFGRGYDERRSGGEAQRDNTPPWDD